MKILICGDSFAAIDPKYPGAHWSEIILNYSPEFEIMNLSYGGSSNALIAFQLSMGLKFNPDFVIFTFTSVDRYEFDNNLNEMPRSFSSIDIADYIKKRYITTCHESAADKKSIITDYLLNTASENFEKIKNYFYIMYCLNEASSRDIKFCYSLGGFEYNQDYNNFINKNFISNSLLNYSKNEISVNLWYHHNPSSVTSFHVDDPKIQNLFAAQCIDFITNESR
jgi:hypothetical protein